MSFEQIVAYVMFATVGAGTPGPANVLLAAVGANVGVRQGLPCLLGVCLGTGSALFTAALGLGTLLLSQPVVLLALKAAAVAFLLWLAWKIATAAPPGATQARTIGFLTAAGLQWVNPKVWLLAVSASATFMSADAGGAFYQASLLGGLFALAALPACAIWLVFGSAMQRLLTSPRRIRRFNQGMAVLLAASLVLVL